MNEELSIIVEEIEAEVRQLASETGDADIDIDYVWMEREFFNEVSRRIKNEESGWELLLAEYGDAIR